MKARTGRARLAAGVALAVVMAFGGVAQAKRPAGKPTSPPDTLTLKVKWEAFPPLANRYRAPSPKGTPSTAPSRRRIPPVGKIGRCGLATNSRMTANR